MAQKHYTRDGFNAALTLGATISLGLLSLSGFYLLTPIMGLVITAFGLSMLYEGEIYHANIGSALKKIFDKEFFLKRRANEVLEALLEKLTENEASANCQFISDYRNHLSYLNKLQHIKKRTKEQEQLLKDASEKLAYMQTFFMKTLFSQESERTSDYQQLLYKQLLDAGFKPDEIKAAADKTRSRILYIGLPAAILMGSIFGFGSLYLVCDAFSVLTFLSVSAAAMPWLVIPLAALAGLGYIGLTFNSLSDMIWNESVQKWYIELHQECKKEGANAATITLVISSLLLVGVAITLTFFTFGTWWTIAKNTKGALPFMLKVPHYVTKAIVPLFNSVAQFIFSLENIKETFDNFKSSISRRLRNLTWSSFKNVIQNIQWSSVRNFFVSIPYALIIAPGKYLWAKARSAWEKENIIQFLNPFRLVLKIVESPIRILGFIGHVISIGATTDEVPGVPTILCAIISSLSETFEDMHYFFDLSSHHSHEHEHDEAGEHEDEHGHGHGHGHCNHSHDIPTKFYRLILLPIRSLATLWHWGFSQLSRLSCFNTKGNHPVFTSYQQANDNLTGQDKIETVANPTVETSSGWKKAQALLALKEKEQQLPESSEKRHAIHQLADSIEETDKDTLTADKFRQQKSQLIEMPNESERCIANILSEHRHKLHFSHTKTDSDELVEYIERSLASAAA